MLSIYVASPATLSRNGDVNGTLGDVIKTKMADVNSKMQLIKSVFFYLMEDEDINDEYDNAIDEIAIVMQHVANERKIRQRIAEFFTETVPAYSPDEFSSHFRMRRETFEEVCRQVIQWTLTIELLIPVHVYFEIRIKNKILKNEVKLLHKNFI